MLEARNQTNLAEITGQAPNVTLKPQGAAFGPSHGRLHPRRRAVRLQSGARAGRRHLRRRRLFRDADRLDLRPARSGARRDPARSAGHAGRQELDRRRGEAVLAQAGGQGRLSRRAPTARAIASTCAAAPTSRSATTCSRACRASARSSAATSSAATSAATILPAACRSSSPSDRTASSATTAKSPTPPCARSCVGSRATTSRSTRAVDYTR